MQLNFSKKFLQILAGLAAIILVGLIVKLVFFKANENEKIEKMLHQLAERFVAKDFRGVAEFLTDDAVAEPGADKETMVMQMKGFFFQVRDLSASIELIKHENEKLPANASQARAIVVVKVSGTIDGNKFQAFGEHGADAALVNLRKVEEKWLISRARYLDLKDPMQAMQQFKH